MSPQTFQITKCEIHSGVETIVAASADPEKLITFAINSGLAVGISEQNRSRIMDRGKSAMLRARDPNSDLLFVEKSKLVVI